VGSMGYGAPFPGKRRKRKEDESIIKRELATENKQTVDDVIRLLMERGIMT